MTADRSLTTVGFLTLFSVITCLTSVPNRVLADDLPKVEIGQLKLLDVKGERYSFDANSHRTGTAFVFLSSECPISRQYVPELNRLQKAAESAAGTVAFYGVLSDPTLSRKTAVKFVDEFKITFPVLFDSSGELAELFRPDHVPQAFLVNAAGAVVYRGRIDDLYPEIGKRRPEPTSRDLFAAITALAEKRPIEKSRTDTIGCPFEAEPTKAESVSYARDIAPILFAHCVECHRPGEVAPFSLLSYQDAAKRAEGITRATANRLMPPWRAEVNYGHFMDERRLTDREIALIKAWAESGRAEGSAADLPPTPQFSSGWRLGEPDELVEVQAPFEVRADGPDIFHHFVLPTKTEKDEMIVGIEFRPGNAAVIHHAIVYLDTSGRARARDAETPEPGWSTSGSIDTGVTGMVGVWTPGMTPRFFPEDVGIPLDKGADIVVQLHIHPSGKVESDQSKVALYYAKKPVTKVISRNPLIMGSLAIEIPVGEKRHKLSSTVTLPTGLTVNSVFPHMHLIGREMKLTATLPDQSILPMIWIKDWSFYWQDSYVFSEPVHLPKGTVLDVEAYYDNSSDNPFNPQSPPQKVLFGNGTNDEMCFALLQAVPDDPKEARQIGGAMMQALFEQWNTAKISPEARAVIAIEMAKLFGGRRRAANGPATGNDGGNQNK